MWQGLAGGGGIQGGGQLIRNFAAAVGYVVYFPAVVGFDV
jgi:hypothetical protein